MPVFKATYNVVAFGEFDTHKEAEAFFSLADPEYVLSQCVDGDLIGQVHLASVDDVPNDKLRTELEAIGNDGDFFGSVDDDSDNGKE